MTLLPTGTGLSAEGMIVGARGSSIGCPGDANSSASADPRWATQEYRGICLQLKAFRPICQAGFAGAARSSARRNRKISTRGASYRIALLSRRRTDLLLTGIREWPAGTYADPRSVEGRAAWYSLAP